MSTTFWLTDEDSDVAGYLRLKLGARSDAPSLVRAITATVAGSHPEGVTMTVSLANAVASPYDLAFTSLGATTNAGTVTFTYAGRTRTVTIPAVGDPTMN